MSTHNEKWVNEFINSDATIEDVASGKFKMSYEALEESYFKACEGIKEIVTENNKLKEENKKLKEKIKELEKEIEELNKMMLFETELEK